MNKLRENFMVWLAYQLPPDLVYYAAVRLLAFASLLHASTPVDALTPKKCLESWRKEHGTE